MKLSASREAPCASSVALRGFDSRCPPCEAFLDATLRVTVLTLRFRRTRPDELVLGNASEFRVEPL